MKLAISSAGQDLNAELDPRFGRCPYFILVDSDTMNFEAIDNSSAMSSGGAGISAAQLIAGKGANVVLTGSCGPNAFEALNGAGIKVITGLSGSVKDAVDKFKSGQLNPISQPDVSSHFGMQGGQGGGQGMGGGGGRGMGGGGGRGMGGGRGRGRGI
jgi:predicted Fe-Mo cluster-binding NifX family protein